MNQTSIFKRLFLLLLIALSANTGYAAKATTVQFKIFISSPTYVPTVSPHGDLVTVTFADPGLTALISKYQITSFVCAHALSRYPYMQQYWLVTVNNINMMTDMLNYSPTVFPWGMIVQPVTLISYPNDYGKSYGGSQGELDLVNMRTAWAIDTGKPNIVVGDYDSYFDVTNIDLTGKFARLSHQNTIPASQKPNHGSATAGIIAGHTNNDTLLASVCPGCMLDGKQLVYNSAISDSNLEMSLHGDRIINASYGACGNAINSGYSIDDEIAYDEIYENGSIMVCAAGDGIDGGVCANETIYWYPASYSHNFSVTAVGYDPTPGAIKNVKNLHNASPNDTNNTATHNDRVDLMAPGYNIHVLASGGDPSNIGLWTEVEDGSSFSSPMVAGACGLLLAHNVALSPYQLGYILKKTANVAPFNYSLYPQNIPYNGLLGAGILDAGAALQCLADSSTIPIDPNLTTLTIDGVEISTLCPPPYAINGVNPQLTTHVSGGSGVYTYNWMPLPLNYCTLDDVHSANPTIVTAGVVGRFNYYLEVTDNNPTYPKRASKMISINLKSTLDWDLAMQDSYMDIGNEPNTQAVNDPIDWQIWASPDIWNRVVPDGVPTNQDPQYTGNIFDSNFVYTRIRNLGCLTSPIGKHLRLYWTKASTGETWPGDWDTATFNGWAAGHEITAAGAISIDSIPPGQSIIVRHGWLPPRPQNYNDSLTDVEACLLARIEDGHSNTTVDSMTIAEVPNVSTNVINNNNIATRNLTVFNQSGFKKQTHQVGVGNSSTTQQFFNIDIATDKHFQHAMAGDISAIISSIKLTLSPALFANWVAADKKGNYTDYDESGHTVTFSPASDFMQLKNIKLLSGEKEWVTIETTGNPAIGSYQFAPFNLNVVQDMENGSDSTIYGAVTYTIMPDNTLGRQAPSQTPAVIKPQTQDFWGYPNPTHDAVTIFSATYKQWATITVVDVLGKTLQQYVHDFGSTAKSIVNLTSYAPGIYAVHIYGTDGKSQVIKVVRQ